MDPRFDLQPGRILGRNYEIIEFLGSGWEGEVYKVEERSTGIPRALKLFHDRAKLSDRVLRRYAMKLYRLRKCSIVTQYHHRDTVRIAGRPVQVLVSDFAEGRILAEYIRSHRRNKLPDFEALHLLYAIVMGVEQIHALGQYHGDIHTDNVLVQRRGLGYEIHLLDFFDLGRSTRQRVQEDVYDLAGVLHEMVGGVGGYRDVGSAVREMVMGRRHSLLSRRFRHAGDMRLALDNLEW